jgi:uncharacterized membrane protein YphA (DoxX/SURF4 family)
MGLGVRVYGLGAIALGLVGLKFGDFALQWQPAPASVPYRTELAYGVGAALVLAGLLLNWRRTAGFAAAALAILFALDVGLLHGPLVAAQPTSVAVWNGVAEQLALFAGALAAFSSAAKFDPELAHRLMGIGRVAFGLCLLTFGVAHFSYLSFTASMVPKWLPPGQTFWAAATGVAHLLAGVAVLTGAGAHLASRLVTLMFIGFGALVHAPSVLADPSSHLNWVSNAMNLALVGAAWTIADAIALHE